MRRMAGRTAWIVPATVIPFVLAGYLFLSEAHRQTEQSTLLAGESMLRQIEAIVDSAVVVADQLLPLAGKSCEKFHHTLDEIPPRQAYIRAASLMRQRELYCSSEGGESWRSLVQGTGATAADYVGRHFFLLDGTEQVPDRLALVLFSGMEDGRGVAVTIDGQYLLDVLGQFNSSPGIKAALTLQGGRRVAAYSDDGLSTGEALESSRYPIILNMHVPEDAVFKAVVGLWRLYGVFVLALAGGFGYAVFHLHHRRLSLARDIRRAMRNGEFFMEYQPVIELDSGVCTGVEALMRWHKPGVGLIRPDFVFSVAEENSLAIPLSRHLYWLIARDVVELRLPTGFHLGINVVPEHVDQQTLLEDVAGLRKAAERKQARLVLEITERRPLPATALVQSNIDALRGAGIQIAIDDFGTGHSSLCYLEKYPMDYIKIDRGFVSTVSSGAFTAPVLDMIIGLGRRLGIGLIAEGIETEAQADYLRSQGVRYGQGFLYARPMSAPALQSWLDGCVKPFDRAASLG